MKELITKPPVALEKTAVISRSRKVIRWKEQFVAYLFLLPVILLFGTFAWYPIVNLIPMSFQNIKLAGDSTWIGFDNYSRMFSDPLFIQAWVNSLQFALISVALGFAVPIFVAIMVNEMRHLKWFFRLIYFLPSLIPVVIYVLVWRLIYAPQGGFLNSLLGVFGIGPQIWLQNSLLVKPAIIVILTWANFGGTMLIYLAALNDLSPELYEAAEIDGASPFQRVFHITLPYLKTTMKLLLVLQIMTVAQIFTEPLLLTNGGPANSTMTPVQVIYKQAFANNDFGLASAWSVVMVCFLAIFSIFYLRLSRIGGDAE